MLLYGATSLSYKTCHVGELWHKHYYVIITSNKSPLFMLFNFIDNKAIYTIQFDGE